MGLSFDTVAQRVKVEGKDSLDQHRTIINDFIKDIVREITSTFRFEWLLFENTITTTGTWINLDEVVRGILGADIDGKPITYISESEYFFKKSFIHQGNKAYYRHRWNYNRKCWQINFINVDDNVDVDILERHVYHNPKHLPPELEEAVVEGCLYKYLRFLEGDDTTVAQTHKSRYIELTQQYFHLLDNEFADEDKDRVLTNAEIEMYRAQYYEDDD